MTQFAPEPSQPVYLTTDALLARYGGVSRMWIHRRQKKDGFPKAVHLGSSPTNFYPVADLDGWDAARMHSATNRAVPKKARDIGEVAL
jgi:predicted DNA-binding transcriptional regulator AlpA